MNPNVPGFSPIELAALKALEQLDACSVANAIESFGVRLRNSGFADATVRCQFDDLPPLVGYAATLRIRTSEPPMEGESYYYRLDWLDHLMKIPAPRVLVVEDIDSHPGLGAFVGEVHANILIALGCVGVVTNGAVRDIPAAHALRFPMFARAVSPSHAFAHVLDYGNIVHVGGLQLKPGDLLHGDRHGVQTVPLEIAAKVPAVAQRMNAEEAALIEFCRSNSYSLDKLRSEVEALGTRRKKMRDPNS